MTKIKRLVAIALALLMVFGSVSVMASAWDATVDDGFDLGITTKIYREVNGEWVETEKVKAGESVKARVFIDTNYFTNTGSLLFFYNTSFFEDAYSAELQELEINPYYSQKPYYFKGTFYSKLAATGIDNMFVNAGAISRDFADTHNYFSLSFEIDGKNKNKVLDGSKWFCEFDLTVKADAAGAGNFYALDSTVLTPSFRRGYINVSKGPSFGYVENVVSMADWQANVAIDYKPVYLYKNYVEATFDAGQGMFESTNETTAVYVGEANSAVTVEAPIREGFKFNGWVASGSGSAPTEIIALPAADTTYTASWASATDYDETLAFKTDFYRFDETAGEWVYTEKVIPGETVKARLYIDTTYFTNAGNLIMFYDSDFFTCAYPENVETALVVNDNPSSSAAISGASGTFTLAADDNAVVKKLVDNNYITQDFVDTHEAITAVYTFNPPVGQKLSGEYYFAEWEFQVKDDATGEGDFFIVQDTIQNANEGKYAHISVHVSTDGGSDRDVISLFEVNLNTVVESHPVSTYSKITFDANTGAFDAADTDTFVIEGDIKDLVDASTIPAISKDGYTFKGWGPAEIAEPTVADVVEVPAEIPFDELELKALWVNQVDITFNNNNGTADTVVTVTAGDAFEAPADPELEGHYFVGWTADPSANPLVLGLPATYPTTDTTYTAVFETYAYDVEYFVLNPETGAFESVTNANVAYGDEINLVPPSYTAPEGYTLSPAYKDITFTTLANAGETMPVGGVKLYYQLTANEYDAVFKLDGGNINGDTADVVVKTVYGEAIKAPANPVKEGYTFMGWTPMVGNMDELGQEFVATWEVNTYYAEYVVDGETYEKYDIPYGAAMEMPADPELEGYTFIGWDKTIPETMPAEDVVYNAVFEANKYDVTFDLDDGNINGDTSDVVVETTYGEDIQAPADPEKEGYTFAGWEPALPDTMPAKNLEFAAQWKANANVGYVLEIYEMGTDGQYPADPTTTMTFNDGVVNDERSVSVDVPTGFKLSATSNLSGTIPATGTLVLKAYLERDVYTLTLDIDGTIIEEDYYYGEIVTADPDTDKNGWTFVEWIDTNTDAQRDIPVNMPAEDVSLKATYTKDSYPANFDAGEGKFESTGEATESVDVPFAEFITAPTEEPVRDGYVFEGWALPTDPETVVTNYGRMDADGADFVAVWSKDSFVVRYHDYLPSEFGPAVSDDMYIYDEQTYEFEAPIVFPEEPSITHYVFLGWVDANGLPVEEGTPTPAGGMDLYASYERVKVMLIPKNDTCTTVIDRAGLTVDDYTEDSLWYVYGLEEIMSLDLLLGEYIDVQGDGRIVVTKHNAYTSYYGTGATIDVYDNVTGELVESFTIIIFGDLDGNSYVNSGDVSICLNEVHGMTGWSVEGGDEYAHYLVKAANVRKDLFITVADYNMINLHALGMEVIDQVTGTLES